MINTRPSALPKSTQLSEMLIREIAAGHLADGARLPPERAMAARHGVAVGTLRKALAELETRGLLERVQGSGNYVRARPVVDNVYAFFRLERDSGGGLPTADVLDVLRLTKPAEAARIGPSQSAHRIRRVRFLDEVAVALEEIWLDDRFTRKICIGDLMDSLYLFYKNRLGLIISRVEDKVGVSGVPAWGAADIGLVPGTAAGFVERFGWGGEETPAEYSRTWFNPARARYTTRLQ